MQAPCRHARWVRHGKAAAGEQGQIDAALRIAHGTIADELDPGFMRGVGKVEAGGIVGEVRPLLRLAQERRAVRSMALVVA